MPEFPSITQVYPPAAILSPASPVSSQLGFYASCAAGVFNGTGTWPVANTALYLPVMVPEIVTVYKMSVQVQVQSGNLDVGIYDEQGNRLVSSGSTVVGTAGIQIVDITDTVLHPGVYYLAMNVDNTTASFNRANLGVSFHVLNGGKQQAVGAVTLPSTATFATIASSYAPSLSAHLVATV